jgi:preflagellin peptidase FlaK
MLIVTYIKLIVSLSLLSYASIEDLKHREISDLVWLFFNFLAFSINLASLFVFHYFYIDAISIVYALALLVIFLSLYYVGAYGGADAKALVSITLMFPSLSEKVSLSNFTLLPIPVATFFYASVLSLIQVPINLVHNLLLIFKKEKVFEGIKEPTLKKVFALLLLRKERIKKSYINLFFTPAEIVLEDGSRRLTFFSNTTSNVAADEGELIFVSPLIPFVFFLTFGFLFFVVFGDYILVNIIKVAESLVH